MAMLTKSTPALTSEYSISPSQALESDTALQAWEQELERHVSSGISKISSSEEASLDTIQEAHETTPEIDSVAKDSHQVSQRGGGTCTGQLVLDPHSSPADVVLMYQGLKTHLKAEIISVEHLRQGVILTCILQDLAMFLGVLPKLPKFNSWSFSLS